MSDPPPSFDEWRRFLIEEMSILDKVWERDLDDIWTYTTTQLARTIGEIADGFYVAYWEMFRATLQEDNKSWEEMKREAKAAAEGAKEHVSRGWATVIGDKIDRLERDLDLAKEARASVLRPKQLLREARTAKGKAEKAATRDQYDDAITQYRNALDFAIQADDELEETRRQAALVADQQRARWISIRLKIWHIILVVITVAIGLGGLVFGIYQYVQSRSPGQP